MKEHEHTADHADMAADFRKRFWISLVVTLPILALSPLLQSLVGLREAIRFPGDLYLTYQVHNEAIAIPETIDCIRALTGLETDASRSIAKTDRALGITKVFLPATPTPSAASA